MPEAGSEAFDSLATRVLAHDAIAQLLVARDAPASVISPVSLCAGLTAARSHLSIVQQGALIALCRKICVAKQVYAEYLPDWRPAPGARPLVPVELLVVAATCFWCAEPLVTSDRGLALHLINAGFRSIERAAAPSTETSLQRDVESVGEAALAATRRR